MEKREDVSIGTENFSAAAPLVEGGRTATAVGGVAKVGHGNQNDCNLRRNSLTKQAERALSEVPIEVEDAIEKLRASVSAPSKTEKIPLLSALNRVLVNDIVAPFDQPPFNRSPLDGYTFAASSTKATPAALRIVGQEYAGESWQGTLHDGEALAIATGAPIPAGADCVIRMEDVTVEGDTVFIPRACHAGENVCPAGEDMRAGTQVLTAGTRLGAVEIAVLASLGFADVTVYRLPRIAIAATGDELLTPGEQLRPGRIYDSNLYYLASRLHEFGFEPIVLGRLSDEPSEAAVQLAPCFDDSGDAIERANLVLTTGGVSVGPRDVMHGARQALGAREVFWRVAMKPGAPVLAYEKSGTLGIALSGNPFAACATFELLVRPVLAKLAARPDLVLQEGRAMLVDDFPKASRGRRFLRARLADGRVHLPAMHASGALSSAIGCNAFVDISAGSGALAAGTDVRIWK